MSEFKVQVGVVNNIQKHPNADTLEIGEIYGYPVIFKTGEFTEGSLAVHIPVDSIVPDRPEWAFLDGHRRIRAKKLRGIFSMGLVIKPQPGWKKGQIVQKELGILKYDPDPELRQKIPKTWWQKIYFKIRKFLGLTCTHGLNEKDPGFLPVYTDIEGYRRYKNLLIEGEEVVLTEKCHGSNARFVYVDGRLWVGSHHMIKRCDSKSMWWKVAMDNDLENKLSKVPGIAVYGEIYGPQVQDLTYGVNTIKLVLFDALDVKTRKYLNYDDFKNLAKTLDIPTVPELFRGLWSKDLLKFADGKTTFKGANHIREGFVVKPVVERYDLHVGRVILKMVSERYLLRKSQ